MGQPASWYPTLEAMKLLQGWGTRHPARASYPQGIWLEVKRKTAEFVEGLTYELIEPKS
jgi:hypothetical protein